MTDLRVAAGDGCEAQSARGGGRVRLGCVDGIDRIAVQHVLDVHEQQLLVLLLVMQPEHDERRGFGIAIVDELVHRVVDVRAVASYLGDRRAREQASLRTRMTRTDRLVVGVEEIRIRGVEGCVVFDEW